MAKYDLKDETPTAQAHPSGYDLQDEAPKAPGAAGVGTLGTEPEAAPGRPAQAALEAYGNGLTAGYLPQLQAKAEPYTTKILNALTGQNVQSPSYLQARDENVARQKKLVEENPKVSMAAGLAGTLHTGALLPGSALGKGAPLAAKMLAGAATGAGIGALSNPGDEPGKVNPLQMTERLENAKMGAALGGVAPAVPVALSAAKDRLANLAEKAAFKALGPYARDALLAFGKDKVNAIGRTLLDNKVVRALRPTSYGGLGERAEAAAAPVGERLGQITDQLDGQEGANFSREKIAQYMSSKTRLNPDVAGAPASNARTQGLVDDFANAGRERYPLPRGMPDSEFQEIRQTYGKPVVDSIHPGQPSTISNDLPAAGPGGVNRGRRMQVSDDIDRTNIGIANEVHYDPYGDPIHVPVSTFEKTGVIPNDRITFKTGRGLKKDVGDAINWKRLQGADIPLEEQVQRAQYTALAHEEDRIAERLASEGTTPGAKEFKGLKNTYENLKTAGRIAPNREAKNFANRLISPSDYGMMTGGAVIGGLVGDTPEEKIKHALMGAALGGLNKVGRTYGPQVVAGTANSASKAAAKAAAASRILETNPWLMPMMGQSLKR